MTDTIDTPENTTSLFGLLGRLGAIGGVVLFSWLMVPVVFLAAFLVGNDPLVSGGLAVAFALTGNLGVISLKGNEWRPVAAAMALIGQAIALTAAFAGHGWQTDIHMLYFAVLAVVASLASIRAILASVVLIALHHASFGVLLPTLIYPSVQLLENLERTALHAVIVVIEAAVLIQALRVRNRLDEAVQQSAASAAETARNAEIERDKAVAAQREAHSAVERADEERERAHKALEDSKIAQQEAQTAQEAVRQQDEYTKQVQAEEASKQQQVVEALRRALNALKDGDLTFRITEPFADEYDDLRFAFNDAVGAVHLAIGEVSEQAALVDEQAANITSASKHLAERTERQAATLQETAAAIEQLNQTLASSSATVAQSAERATDAQNSAQDTENIVKITNDSMHQIEESSGEINRIVTVIDDIAFQTNLLALNAGVEAARAGEAGRGFSVVASEVRALAQRSSDSAKDIRGLIEASSEQISGGVKHMESTVGALSRVLHAIGDITGQMGNIAASSKEQAAGIGSINDAISQLEQVTQQNAAMFEETTAASAELSYGANRVLALTRKFRTEVEQELATNAA